MNTRHFARLAKALGAFRRTEGASLTYEQYHALIDQIALACSEFNPAFKYGLFEDTALSLGIEGVDWTKRRE